MQCIFGVGRNYEYAVGEANSWVSGVGSLSLHQEVTVSLTDKDKSVKVLF
ncbi:hypothetical protein [Anaeromicropila populeti]|nr:hypothetical protein [Anaeromicropila populeti]